MSNALPAFAHLSPPKNPPADSKIPLPPFTSSSSSSESSCMSSSSSFFMNDTHSNSRAVEVPGPVHEVEVVVDAVAVLAERAVHRARVVDAVARDRVLLEAGGGVAAVDVEVGARVRARLRHELEDEALAPPERRRQADRAA